MPVFPAYAAGRRVSTTWRSKSSLPPFLVSFSAFPPENQLASDPAGRLVASCLSAMLRSHDNTSFMKSPKMPMAFCAHVVPHAARLPLLAFLLLFGVQACRPASIPCTTVQQYMESSIHPPSNPHLRPGATEPFSADMHTRGSRFACPCASKTVELVWSWRHGSQGLSCMRPVEPAKDHHIQQSGPTACCMAPPPGTHASGSTE